MINDEKVRNKDKWSFDLDVKNSNGKSVSIHEGDESGVVSEHDGVRFISLTKQFENGNNEKFTIAVGFHHKDGRDWTKFFTIESILECVMKNFYPDYEEVNHGR